MSLLIPHSSPVHHDLKLDSLYFDAVVSGFKSFEIRLNDRDYRPNDTITFREYDSFLSHFTGRMHHSVICFVTDFQQLPGYVVFSISSLREGDQ